MKLVLEIFWSLNSAIPECKYMIITEKTVVDVVINRLIYTCLSNAKKLSISIYISKNL